MPSEKHFESGGRAWGPHAHSDNWNLIAGEARALSEFVTLELSEETARSVKEVAVRTHRRPEDVLTDWINHIAEELPAELLPDDEVLALCDLRMKDEQREELSEFLAYNREGSLSPKDEVRLDELMRIYRHGLVRKAQALKVAVDRGLKPPLN